MANEKIIEKIKNLFDLANNNPNEHEAIAAALKAQELMAKHNINISELNTDKSEKEIYQAFYKDNGKHVMKKWKMALCGVVAENFCCEVYLSGTSVVFYGYKKDAKIAVEVFRFLYEAGNKFAVRYYNKCKKEGKNTKGVMNTYLTGFVLGIKEVLDKQCTALMIVTPKEVTDSFEEMSKNWGKKSANLKTNGDNDAYNQGKIDGKETATARGIEDKN